MPRTSAKRSLLPLLAALCAMLAGLPPTARASDEAGDAVGDLLSTDEDDEFGDDDLFNLVGKASGLSRPATPRARSVSHFAIKPEARFGLRHALAKDLSLEVFVRGRQTALDNPFSMRTSGVSGGLEMARKFGATTWLVTFETAQGYSRFYQHTTRIGYDLHTSLQHQIKLGGSAISITPRVEVGQQWSDDARQHRWKFVVKAPVTYRLSDTLVLIPLLPKLTYEPYADRTDGRADWIMNVSAGIRLFVTPDAYVETEFGFENRWSNVHNVEYSRWVLAPKINLRMSF